MLRSGVEQAVARKPSRTIVAPNVAGRGPTLLPQRPKRAVAAMRPENGTVNGRKHRRIPNRFVPARAILSASDLLRRCARLCGARFPKDKSLDRDGVLPGRRVMTDARQGWVKSRHRDRLR